MYNEKIESLIAAALADGILTNLKWCLMRA